MGWRKLTRPSVPTLPYRHMKIIVFKDLFIIIFLIKVNHNLKKLQKYIKIKMKLLSKLIIKTLDFIGEKQFSHVILLGHQTKFHISPYKIKNNVNTYLDVYQLF